jgi:tyrosine-protein kinase Etk/Wzc
MNKTSKQSVNDAFRPLIDAAPPQDAKWLEILLGSNEAISIYSTLDSEIFALKEEVPSSLLITSAVTSEGKTSMAVLLAAFSSVQDTQRKFLIIDADLHSGSLASLFSMRDAPGLFDFFNAEKNVDFNKFVHESPFKNLWVTPLGQDITGMGLLSPKNFKQFMDWAVSEFDLVIVDGPAASSSRSVSILAKIVHNCVLVVRYGGPTREQVQSLTIELDRVGVNILGSILNQRELVIPGFLYGSR